MKHPLLIEKSELWRRHIELGITCLLAGIIFGVIIGFWWCWQVNYKPAVEKLSKMKIEFRNSYVPPKSEGKGKR